MTPLNASTATRAAALFLGVISLMPAQGLNALTPSKEYIRMGGQVIAIENAPPGATSGGSQSQ
jgi:hypothetical protein